MLVTRKSKRKPTGGLRHSLKRKNKTLSQLANPATLTTIANTKEVRKVYRGKGANKKVKAVAITNVNLVLDKKIVKATIKSVKKNLSNREYTRKNIITKGCEILVSYKDKEYLAKVTSRPGQDGIVNAVTLSVFEDVKEKKPKTTKK
jgi:small subunit ribosomal protein S8e